MQKRGKNTLKSWQDKPAAEYTIYATDDGTYVTGGFIIALYAYFDYVWGLIILDDFLQEWETFISSLNALTPAQQEHFKATVLEYQFLLQLYQTLS